MLPLTWCRRTLLSAHSGAFSSSGCATSSLFCNMVASYYSVYLMRTSFEGLLHHLRDSAPCTTVMSHHNCSQALALMYGLPLGRVQ